MPLTLFFTLYAHPTVSHPHHDDGATTIVHAQLAAAQRDDDTLASTAAGRRRAVAVVVATCLAARGAMLKSPGKKDTPAAGGCGLAKAHGCRWRWRAASGSRASSRRGGRGDSRGGARRWRRGGGASTSTMRQTNTPAAEPCHDVQVEVACGQRKPRQRRAWRTRR